MNIASGRDIAREMAYAKNIRLKVLTEATNMSPAEIRLTSNEFWGLAKWNTRIVTTTTNAVVTAMELESLTGLPAEEVGFILWYLREKGAVNLCDGSSDYAISGTGVDMLGRHSDLPRQAAK